MLAITLLLLIFVFILLLLFTAIGFTFKFNILSLEEKEEFKGTFTVKWLLFSHTFSLEEDEKESLFEESEYSIEDKKIKEKQSEIGLDESKNIQTSIETQNKAEEKEPDEEKIEVDEIKAGKIEIDANKGKTEKTEEDREKKENKEKKGIIARIRGQKEPEIEETMEAGMSTREMLHWALEAFKSLRGPLFRLFSDLLNGIKVKRLKSDITFGLSDPADTGMLCGFIHVIAGLTYSRYKNCSFFINPVFTNPIVDFRGDIDIRVRIYSLILPMLKFMFNRKTLSFTYSIIKEKLWGKWKFKLMGIKFLSFMNR
jgi:hypothetical protein